MSKLIPTNRKPNHVNNDESCATKWEELCGMSWENIISNPELAWSNSLRMTDFSNVYHPVRLWAAEWSIGVLTDVQFSANMQTTHLDMLLTLRWASEIGHVNVFKKLLALGLTNDQITFEDNAALCLACANGQTEFAMMIVDAVPREQLISNNIPLQYACKNGRVDVIMMFIDTFGIDYAKLSNNEPVFQALMQRRIDIVQLLLHKGLTVQDVMSRIEDVVKTAITLGHKITLEYIVALNKQLTDKNTKNEQ